MDFVIYAIPFFLLAIAAELLWDTYKGTGYYRANDSINSLSLGVISTTSTLVVIDIAGSVYGWLQSNLSLAQWSENTALWQYVFAFVLYDLCYYAFHRYSHERKLFWAAHVAHHQSEEYNLTTALRQTSMSFLLSWLFYIPCFLLGMPSDVFVTVASLNLIYQFWVHTRFIPELGPLEYIFVTPSNHRVHHARNPVYIDKNYGGVFIIWDRLFSTYTPERQDVPVDYGIASGLDSWNPLWANLHIYWRMFQDSITTQHWRDKLAIWVGRTSFSPADINRQGVPPGHRYNPEIPPRLRNYVIVQFLTVVAFGVLLKYNYQELGELRSYGLFIYILLSLISLGWLLEKRWLMLEYPRLISLPAAIYWVWPHPSNVSMLLSVLVPLCIFSACIYYYCLRTGLSTQHLATKKSLPDTASN